MSDQKLPTPSSEATEKRWEQSAKVFRMSTGKWVEDARAHQHTFFGKTAQQFLPEPVISRNPLLTFNRQKAVIYDEAPVVSLVDDDTDGEITADPEANRAEEDLDLSTLITEALWPLRQECLLLTLTTNECAMRVDWDERENTCRYRVVPAHRIEAWSSPEDPTNPYKVRELRPRVINGEALWTWETWDVGPKRDQSTFTIEKVVDGDLIDVTEAVMGSTDYPYNDADGAVMPYVLYHSRVTNRLFSPWHGSELVDGTLVVATCWTWWLGGLRDGSYPQRVIFNGKVKTTATAASSGQRGVEYIEMSPLMLLQIDGENASIGQYQASMDPQSVGQAIEAFEVGLASHADLSPGDLTQAGTSGMSGYAIAISREGLRKAQVRLIPSQRMGDRLLLATAARISNVFGGTKHSTHGPDYLIAYSDIPKSLQETTADLDRYERLTALNLMDPVDAMLDQNPSWTRKQAISKILDVMSTKAELDVAQGQFGGTSDTDAPALNGAQVDKAVAIVAMVVNGQLPITTAQTMLMSFFKMPEAEAVLMLSGVANFTPMTPPPGNDNGNNPATQIDDPNPPTEGGDDAGEPPPADPSPDEAE